MVLLVVGAVNSLEEYLCAWLLRGMSSVERSELISMDILLSCFWSSIYAFVITYMVRKDAKTNNMSNNLFIDLCSLHKERQ